MVEETMVEETMVEETMVDEMMADSVPEPANATFSQVADGIAERGYAVLAEALPRPVAESLCRLARRQATDFYPAGVGRGTGHSQDAALRRDRIAWIDDGEPEAALWTDWTRRLQLHLNRRLFLGLFSFESHFARYEPGDFYRKHLDAFRGRSNRLLSLVVYLNEDWRTEDGGELILYDPQSAVEITRVTPQFGTLVLFLSEEFPHEVLPANRPRCSVAGWFRVNTSTSGYLDPPT